MLLLRPSRLPFYRVAKTSDGRIAPIDFMDQDFSMMIPRYIAAALCVLGPLTCAAHGASINGEATYISFQVPGALGTYPMSINASMTVTGYYYVSPAVTRGFLRDAEGTITTFDVDVAGAFWIEPESINARGDITGFYELAAGIPQGFLRSADGHITTFLPPPYANHVAELALPVSINEFGEIAGTFAPETWSPVAFTRSNAGVFKTISPPDGNPDGAWTEITASNGSGAVVGFRNDPGGSGFLAHPDGFWAQIVVPLAGNPSNCENEETMPQGINAGGTIAGWYNSYLRSNGPPYTSPCDQGGVFVLSPDGVYTLFAPPGSLYVDPSVGLEGSSVTLYARHTISIDQAGDIAGSYVDAASIVHGFVRNPYGTITSFDPPEGKMTEVTSISDGGAIAGWYQYNSGGGPPVGFIRVP